MRVLAIGSHYDDVEIGCGGSLLWHRNMSDKIFIAVIDSDDTRAGDKYARLAEQHISSEILDAKLLLFSSITLPETIVSALDEIVPDIIYLPYEKDYHPHHQRAHMIGMSVARRFTADVFQYIVTTSYSYWPNCFRLIDLEEKLKLVSVFKSQIERRPEYITILKQQHEFFKSFLNGQGDAEGFIVQRIVLK